MISPCSLLSLLSLVIARLTLGTGVHICVAVVRRALPSNFIPRARLHALFVPILLFLCWLFLRALLRNSRTVLRTQCLSFSDSAPLPDLQHVSRLKGGQSFVVPPCEL